MKFGYCFFCHGPSKKHWCDNCYPDLTDRQTPRCPVCSKKFEKNRVCGQCLSSPPAFHVSTVAFDYCYPLDRIIHKIKFDHRPDYLSTLCQPLINKLTENNAPLPEIITPVPLSKERQQERGFNQSALIAKTLGKHLDIQHMNLFNKIKDCPPQSTLSRQYRVANVKNAFHLSSRKAFQHVAIVDDIITTGSTVNELAKLLGNTGCQCIEVWALAKTPVY